mgnify:CR=1 FL=1|jgi:hypothetical protein
MSKSRLISGRVKKVTGDLLNPNRSRYLDLSNAEPDLAIPELDGQLLSSTNTGTRYWTSTLTNITLVNTTVSGDIYVSGDVYSQGGAPLYTPRVTISNLAPDNPRVGDFWIDTDNGVEFQYVKDGENPFWIQFTGI